MKSDGRIRDVVHQALELMAGPGVKPDQYTLSTLQTTHSESWLVRARAGDRSDLVFRVIGRARLDPRIPTKAPTSVRGRHIADQVAADVGDFWVVKRPYLTRLMTAEELIGEAAKFGADRGALAHRARTMFLQTLEGLAAIHEEGLAHGDLRPAKIGFLEDGTLVIRDIGLRLDEQLRQPELVAPEVRDSRDVSYTQSTDIFSFLRIARQLLSPFQGDANAPDLAMLDSQVRWLQDFFFPRPERPTATKLRDFFLLKSPPSSVALDDFFDAYAGARPTFKRSSNRRGYIGRVGNLLSVYPETGFAVDGSSSARRLASWLALANQWPLSHNKTGHAGRKRETSRSEPEIRIMEFTKDSLPTTIDSVWRNSVHRMMFGFPLDSEHDQRLSILGVEADEDRKLFQTAIEGANAARQALLEENQFLSTREALELLGPGPSPLQRQEVLVLRRWGFILVVPDHGRALHPAFQFSNGIVSPLIEVVHAKLKQRRGGEDPNPWSELTYWSVKRDRLGGLALSDVLWRERDRNVVQEIIENAIV